MKTYQTVLAIRGPRQSGKGSSLISGGIAVARKTPDRNVVYVAPMWAMVQFARKSHGKDAPRNFHWLTGHNLRRLEKMIKAAKPTLILLDEAQSLRCSGAKQYANRLAKKFKTSVWFTENVDEVKT